MNNVTGKTDEWSFHRHDPHAGESEIPTGVGGLSRFRYAHGSACGGQASLIGRAAAR